MLLFVLAWSDCCVAGLGPQVSQSAEGGEEKKKRGREMPLYTLTLRK